MPEDSLDEQVARRVDDGRGSEGGKDMRKREREREGERGNGRERERVGVRERGGREGEREKGSERVRGRERRSWRGGRMRDCE